MPYNTASADVQHIAHSIRLGDVTLAADSFTMQEERPYEQQKMWNGDWYSIPLGKKPCRLKLQCRVAAALRDVLLPVLRVAMNNQTAYAFTLGGTAFADMKLTAYTLQAENGAAYCCAELEFIGTAGAPAAV